MHMSMRLPLSVSLVLLVPALVHAATLGNPAQGSFYSGIGVVSGWKCTATGPLTVRFNGSDPIALAYGNERPDVRDAGFCPRAHVGFVSIMNWAELGDGTHTAVAYDDGVEFARSTFTVATTGEPFVRGAEGECRVEDFPAPGERMHFEWNQNTQHLEMVSARGEDDTPEAGARAQPPAGSGGRSGPATLENPSDGSFYSGLGVVSGWKCTANGPLTVRFNGGAPLPLAYGNERPDVRDAGACPSAHVGFVSIMNWAELGDGTHTAVVYDDGVEFARSTFTVATTGEPFVRGAEGACRVEDFPAPGETMRFVWNQHTQHLEMVGDRRGGRGDDDEEGGGICDRTPEVVSIILRSFPGHNCEDITTKDLATIIGFTIENSSLGSLKVGDFAGLGNLELLYLRNTQLTTLPPGLFADLGNLKVLTLFENQLTALPPGLFAGLTNLKELVLSGNPGSPFPGVPQIFGNYSPFPCAVDFTDE